MANLDMVGATRYDLTVKQFANTLNIPTLDLIWDQGVGPLLSAVHNRLACTFRAVIWEKGDVCITHEEFETVVSPRSDNDYFKVWLQRKYPRIAKLFKAYPSYSTRKIATAKTYTGKMTVACPHQTPNHSILQIVEYNPMPMSLFKEL